LEINELRRRTLCPVVGAERRGRCWPEWGASRERRTANVRQRGVTPGVKNRLMVEIDPRDARIAELEAQVAARDARIAELTARVEALTGRIAELEARVGQNSTNSSNPPSSDRDFGLETKRAWSRQVEGVETQCTRLARLLVC
jgi:uncharacterized coiled-coil protein SlyX